MFFPNKTNINSCTYVDKRFGGVTTTRQRLDEENLRRKLEIVRTTQIYVFR